MSESTTTLFDKVKQALVPYQLNVINVFEIGYEVDVVSAGRENPLTQSELRSIITEVGIPFICVNYQDAQFGWRVFYNSVVDTCSGVTVDASTISATDTIITVEPEELRPITDNDNIEVDTSYCDGDVDTQDDAGGDDNEDSESGC